MAPVSKVRSSLLRITQDIAYLQPRPQCVASGHISRSTITHLKCPSRRTRSSHPPPQSGAHSQQHLQSTSSGLVLNYAIAYVSHWEYRDRSRFPSFAWRTKEGPRLRNPSIASGALLIKWENGTCPYIPTCPISPRLSMLLWGLPPADSTSPCATAWGCSGRTARSALGAPSNSAGSHSDSR